jgi:EAL domain-containing protein (putative c-di-GMP-specific phosphodiesterase class I)
MQSKPLNLPWHQHDHYWIHLFARGGHFPPAVNEALKHSGMQFVSAGAYSLKAGRDWQTPWSGIHAALQAASGAHMVEAAVVPADDQAQPLARIERRSVGDIEAIANSLWLGDAVQEGRLMCYLQPVVSAKDKVFGYESFARVRAADGSVIAGEAIFTASKALGMEFAIDRMLQVQAIQTFVSSDFNGFFFVNFLPGFIHRPAIYLEGLGEMVRNHGIMAKHIVLEFTKSETPRDLAHLKSVCEYARSRGYSVALDDITTLEGARKLISEVRPDFVKLDMQLAGRVAEPRAKDVVQQVAALTHAAGGTVIGEGVETEENYHQLKELGVDLFQGYYFSAPVPVEKALRRA